MVDEEKFTEKVESLEDYIDNMSDDDSEKVAIIVGGTIAHLENEGYLIYSKPCGYSREVITNFSEWMNIIKSKGIL